MHHRSRKNFMKTVVTAGVCLALTAPALSGSGIGFAQTPELSSPSALQLGWRISCQVYAFRDNKIFFDMVDKLSSIGILNIEGLNLPGLKLSKTDNTTVNYKMSSDKQEAMKKYLADKKMKMPTYYVGWGEDACLKERKLWEFLKNMGVEVLNCEMAPGDLKNVEALSKEFNIPLAIHNHTKDISQLYWKPEQAIKALDDQGALPQVGFCPDIGQWGRSNLDVIKGMSAYHKSRPIHDIHMRDLRQNNDDTTIGTGKVPCKQVLDSLYAWKWKGVLTFDPDLNSKNLLWILDSSARFIEKYAKTKITSTVTSHNPPAVSYRGAAHLSVAAGGDVSMRTYGSHVIYTVSGKKVGGRDAAPSSRKPHVPPGVYIVR